MKSSPCVEILLTADGSHSLFRPDLGEHYHSLHGAVQESEHIFMAAGLQYSLQRSGELAILEVGFGTGLNAWLTLRYLPRHARVSYCGIEAFPLSKAIWEQLNYAEEGDRSLFHALHTAEWNSRVVINESFVLEKIHARIEETVLPSEWFDVIYFDAFAPQYDPSLWTLAVFAQMYKTLKRGGVLVTYCCKGEVKRHLKAVGFVIVKLPGPKGKREFLRAEKP